MQLCIVSPSRSAVPVSLFRGVAMRRLARRVSTFDGADLFIEISDLESIQELRGVKDDYLPAKGFDVLHASMMTDE